MIGLLPSADAPLSPADTSLIAYLRGQGYTDNSQVSVYLRRGNASQSSVVFGGYDEKLLYPNEETGKFVTLLMNIEGNVMLVRNVKTSFGPLSLSN